MPFQSFKKWPGWLVVLCGQFVIAAIVAGCLYLRFLRHLSQTNADLWGYGLPEIPFPREDALWASAIMGVVAGFAIIPLLVSLVSKRVASHASGVTFGAFEGLEGAAKVLGILWFSYSVLAGNLSATTSVKLRTTLPAETLAHRSDILATLDIERGDNWFAEIGAAGISESVLTSCSTVPLDRAVQGPVAWFAAPMPHRPEQKVHLAPKEKTSTSFLIQRPCPDAEITLTAVVVSYSAWWPDPSISFSSARVLARKDTVAETAASEDCDTESD